MTVSQHTSGNLNDVRAYPFADDASRRADGGGVLPENIINDCHIWWPDVYGEVAFVASVTVSPSIMTMTIAAKNVVSGIVTLLAAVQIAKPAVAYGSYPLEIFQPGVGGWVAPGKIADTGSSVLSWLFSTPEQSKLAARVAQPYPSLPVSSIGEYGNANTLDGRVRFIAGRNINVDEQYRYVDGLYTRVIAVGLDEERLPDLYEYFAGPCGKRPESGTCDRVTLKTINGVTPDDTGTLFIDIDDTNSVLEGRIDITDSADGNAALYTPIEYEDVCNTVGHFDPIPEDLCDSSLSAEPMESSLSADGPGTPDDEESSSGLIASVSYDFDSPDELYDFALFSSYREYERDYLIPSPVYGSDRLLLWQDSHIVLPVPEATTQKTALNNTIRTTDLVEIGDFAEIETNITLSREQILALDSGVSGTKGIVFNLELSSGGLQEDLETGPYYDRSIRGQIKFQHDIHPYYGKNLDVVRVFAQIGWFGGDIGGGRLIWADDADASDIDSTATTLLPPNCVEERSSSSVTQAFHSSSSACLQDLPDEINVNLRLRVTVSPSSIGTPQQREEALGTSSSSLGTTEYKFDVEFDVSISDGVEGNDIYFGQRDLSMSGFLDPTTGHTYNDPVGDWSQLHFFGISTARYLPTVSGPFPATPIKVNDLVFRATNLTAAVCDEIDFEESVARVSYLNQYTPDDGWSADFSVMRSFEQFLVSGSIVPEYPSVDAYDAVSLPYQFLNFNGGTSHKYATLKCQESSLTDYVYSAAFKYTGNNAKYGIILGYQGGENDVFWAVVIDPKAQEITYGVHYAGFFQPLGWSPLPSQPFNWLYEWHRLVVHIDSGFTVRAWVDPYVDGYSSSANLTKTIPINYSSPQYLATPIQAWDGNLSGAPQNEFADGSPGIYVFGGTARVAEFTVSPANQDIVVPNKVPWLDGL